MSILIYMTGHVPHAFIDESIFTTSAVQTVTALVLATQSWSNSCALPIIPGGDDVRMYRAILGICAGVNTKCLQLALALAMRLINVHAPTGYLTLPCGYSQSKSTRPCSTSPAMLRQTHHAREALLQFRLVHCRIFHISTDPREPARTQRANKWTVALPLYATKADPVWRAQASNKLI